MKRKDQVLALVDRKEFTYQQIADQLDCSTGYVSACIQRRKHGNSRPQDLRWARHYNQSKKQVTNEGCCSNR